MLTNREHTERGSRGRPEVARPGLIAGGRFDGGGRTWAKWNREAEATPRAVAAQPRVVGGGRMVACGGRT